MADQSKSAAEREARPAPQSGPTGARDPSPAKPQTRQVPASAGTTAGESSDPEVHRLLAELQTAQMNRNALTADEDAIRAADEAVAAAKKPLEDLGYTV
jgi:hypothetical protein